MKKMTRRRSQIIDYVGLHGAMPALTVPGGEPVIIRPGEESPEARRVGWPELFEAIDRRRLVLVWEEGEALDYRFLPLEQARRETGAGRRGWARRALEILRELPAVRH